MKRSRSHEMVVEHGFNYLRSRCNGGRRQQYEEKGRPKAYPYPLQRIVHSVSRSVTQLENTTLKIRLTDEGKIQSKRELFYLVKEAFFQSSVKILRRGQKQPRAMLLLKYSTVHK